MRSVLLFIFSHRLLAIARWDLHFIWVRLRNAASGQRGRIARRLATASGPILLNLGSGPRGCSSRNWVNVDGFADTNVDFVIDLLRPLPFADGAFDGVFSEHVLEHFMQEDAERLVAELARILRPGGRLRVIVPDGEFVLRSYVERPEDLVAYRSPGGTAMEAVNSFFRQRYEHQFMYDWTTMRRLLSNAGFVEVTHSSFGQSEGCPDLVLDDPKYEPESLYVEARRP